MLRELVRLATKSDKEEIRLKASQEVLDRGYGRPTQSTEIGAPGGMPFEVIQRVIVDEARRDTEGGSDDDA